jgi:aromatic ring-opening dioxygenase catalytic subunit (LigB family)
LGKIVLAAGVPHAPQLVTPPSGWPDIYQLVMCASSLEKQELRNEGLEDNKEQLDKAKESFSVIQSAIEEARPDVIIGLTDDHFDNFFLDDYPQFSLFLGKKVDGTTVWIKDRKFQYDCDAQLEKTILDASLNSGFDLSFSEEVHLDYGHLIPLSYLLPRADIPIIPFYTNAYATPQPEPQRCLQLGKFLSTVIEKRTKPDYRVALVASGGMSHYPGEPVAGEIDVKFDKWMLERIESGFGGEELSKLSSKEIDGAGNGEMRSWIVMMGALSQKKPVYTNYILSWRAIIGLGYALWKNQ